MADDSCLVARLFCLVKEGVVEIDNPPLSIVLHAALSLDGIDCNTVSIFLNNGDSLDVGGGRDGQYKCHARTTSGFYDLVNPHDTRDVSDAVSIKMNEEINAFPRCCIVPIEMILIAVECFCLSGDLTNELAWDDTLEYEPL